mgnify:FL=1
MSMDVITSPSFSASERRSRWAALCKVLNVVLAYYQFTAYEASRKDGTRGHAVLITRIIDNGMLTTTIGAADIANLRIPARCNDPHASTCLRMLDAADPTTASAIDGFAALSAAARRLTLTDKQRRSILADLGGGIGAATPATNPPTGRARSRSSREQKCYNCGAVGHLSRSCPEPPTEQSKAAKAQREARAASAPK